MRPRQGRHEANHGKDSMTSEAFASILAACAGKKRITLFMPGLDTDEGLEIDPEKVVPAKAHPMFENLPDNPDSDSLWLAFEEASLVGVGKLKVRVGGPSTLFDVRRVTAIDVPDGFDPADVVRAVSRFVPI